MGKARAEIEITASTNRLAAGLNAARAQVQAFSATVARGVGRAFSAVSSKLKPGETAKRALGNFGGDMMTRGFDSILETAGNVRDFERNLVRMGIAAGRTPEQMASVRASIRATSRDTGIMSDKIQAGGNAYLALTGDVDGTIGAMGTFARIAQASGAGVDDVAQATAALKQAMKLDVAKDTEAAFSALIVQGKAGAVEIKDFAGELAELAPQFAQFAGAQGLGGIREMGAAFQIVRKGAGSASGAATQFRAVMAQLVDPQNVKQLKAIGVNVFDSKNHLRGWSDIIGQIANNKVLKDPKKLAAIFGREEARAGLRSLMAYTDEMKSLQKAGEDTGAVQRDLSTYLQSDAGRIDLAFNNLKETIASVFTPERITAFANAVEGLADKMGVVADAVGVIGDAIGGIYGVGQDIQSALRDDSDFMGGFGGSGANEQNMKTILSGGKLRYDPHANEWERKFGKANAVTNPDSQRAVLAQAMGEMAQRAGFKEQRDKILSLTRDGKTTKESTRAAVVAAYQGQRGGADMAKIIGTSTYGAAEAGEQYIQAMKLTPDQVAKIFADFKAEQAAIAEANGKRIEEAIAKGMAAAPGTTVKIGDNQVAKSERKATSPRTRP